MIRSGKFFLVPIFLTLLFSSQVNAGSWPFFKSDVNRSSDFNGGSFNPPFQQIWTATIDTPGNLNYSSPVSDGQQSYVASTTGKVYAFNNKATVSPNSPIWVFSTGGSIYGSPGFALVGTTNMVFIGSTDGSVYGLNAATGSLVWKQSAGSAIFSSPIVITPLNTQEVLFGSNDGTIRAFNAVDGTPIWSFSTNNYVVASPAYDGGSNFLLCPSYDGYLYALNLATTQPTLAWKRFVGPTRATPAILKKNVFNVSRTGSITVWDIASGAISFPPFALNNQTVASSPAVAAMGDTSRLAVAFESGLVDAIDFTNVKAAKLFTPPTVAWSINLSGPLYSSPAITNGQVFVGAKDGKVYDLDLNTGAAYLGTAPLTIASGSQPVRISPAIDGKYLIVGSSAGQLQAFSAKVAAAPTATPTPTPVLNIKVSAIAPSVNPGDTTTFQLLVSNAVGAGNGVSITVTDAVPDFASFVAATNDSVIPMSFVSPAVGGTGNVVWTIPNLGPGQTATLTLSVKVDPALANTCNLLTDTFEDYNLGDVIPQVHPERWRSTAPSYYTIAADPTGAPNKMAQLQSIFSLLPPFGSRDASVGQYFLNSALTFTSSTNLQIDFVAPSSNMQDIVRMGDFSVSIDGGNLKLQTLVYSNSIDYSFNTFAAAGAWTFGGKMRLNLIYNGNQTLTKASIFDFTQNKVVVQGKTAIGTIVTNYPLQIWNQAVNLQPNGYLYVDNVNLGRSITDMATLTSPGHFVTDFDGLVVNCSAPMAMAAMARMSPKEAGTPTRVPDLKVPTNPYAGFVNGGKPIVAIPNPARNSAVVAFYLSDPAKVTIRLFSLEGAPVQDLNVGDQPAGVGSVQVDLSHMASGIYFAILSADSGSGSVRKGTFKLAVVK